MRLGGFNAFLAMSRIVGVRINLLTRLYVLIGFVLLLATSCNDSVPKGEQRAINETEDGIEDIPEIERLIDITYDHPEKVIHHPDSFLNQVKVLPRSEIGKESYALLLLNIGYVLRENGDVLKSIRFYERAFEYCTKHNLTEPDLVLYIAKPLANLYTRIDDVEKSITLHQKAIKIASKNGKTEYLPSLYNNLAIAYQQKGKIDSVLVICKKGISYTGKKSVLSALLYNTIANAYLGINKVDSANYFNNKALQLFQSFSLKEDTLIWYSSSLKLKSDIAKAHHKTQDAILTLDKSIDIVSAYFPNTKNREKAKYLIARGELYSLGQPKLARADFYTAMSLLEDDKESFYVSDYTYTHALHGLAKVYSKLNLDSAVFYYGKTIENDYQTQQLIVSKASSYKNSEWNRSVLKEYLQLLWKSYVSETVKEDEKQRLVFLMFWAIELSKGRQMLMEVNRSSKWEGSKVSEGTEDAKNELNKLYQQLALEKDQQIISEVKAKIAELRFQFQLSEKYFEQQFFISDFEEFKRFLLKESQSKTLVSYLIQEEGSSYVVSLAGSKARATSINEREYLALDLNSFIDDYFADNPYVYENNPDEYGKRSGLIAKALLPFETNKEQEFLLSPDGPLFKLPIDALIQDGAFLAKKNTIAYTYSFLLNFLNQDIEEYQSKVVLFAKSKHSDGFRDLEFVKDEKRFIDTHFEGQTFEEEKATVNSFLDNLRRRDLLHIATHAVSEENEGPYLVFDSRLTLEGFTYIAMQSPLVILSACESAAGTLIQAEGLESLNKAFLSKGVKGVVAAQWPVDDFANSEMMKLFYQELYVLKSPIKALASSKRIYLDSADPIHQNPWYWASMSYMGADTTIEIEKKRTWVWLLTAFALLSIGLFVYIKKKRVKAA